MSRDYIPVVPKEDVASVLDELTAEYRETRDSVPNEAASSTYYAICSIRLELLELVSRKLEELTSFKVLKNGLEEDDEKYYA